jgi:hypothetical protein
MRYKLTKSSHSMLLITKVYDAIYLIPNTFNFYKSYSDIPDNYKRTIVINFTWLRWHYTLYLFKVHKTPKSV